MKKTNMDFDKSMNSMGSEIRSYGPGSSLNSTSLEFDFSTSFDNIAPTLNKFENDPDKIKVFHSGTHGKQQGTLITRHYLRPDSKCIQCQSCGIFFTPVTFLLHSHDQYGKRIPCNAVQLQLDIEHPTTADRQKWNEFQVKLHSCNGLRISPTKGLSQLNNESSTSRRPLSEIGNKLNSSTTNHKFSNTPSNENASLKRYSSASSLHLINANSSKLDKLLSVSDLKCEKLEGEKKDEYKLEYPNISRDKYRDLTQFAPIIKPLPLATRSTILKPIVKMPQPPSVYANESDVKTQPDKHKTRPDDMRLDSQFKAPHYPSEDKLSTNPIQLLAQAMGLLLKAKEEFESNNGEPQGPVSSSAWRKMYEEERSHRMELEARVRNLEREVRLKKY